MFRRLRAHRRTIAGAGPQQPEATILGLEDSRFSDLYHFLLTESWPVLLAGIVIIFVAVNSVFAIVYMLDKGVENARPGSFADAFFFSVQTMATIGYGKMDPDTFLAEVMMSIEALTGLVGLAMVTGLVFAKFSRPTARVRFSRVAIVSNRDGIPSLQFRMANMRANRIVDVSATVVFARQEKTLEGEEMRRFYDLKLQRDRNSLFIYSWTAIHPILRIRPLMVSRRKRCKRRVPRLSFRCWDWMRPSRRRSTLATAIGRATSYGASVSSTSWNAGPTAPSRLTTPISTMWSRAPWRSRMNPPPAASPRNECHGLASLRADYCDHYLRMRIVLAALSGDGGID